ncbi:NADH-dependent [FeFe] hydrogenase, group A6 [Desulforamulus hydrothermalis]|uniref:Iron hydrogenase 1 n=1 Tax=Desulforamulus hydrothermalis Lam5 = DSM 18033 TaxID=1121428 RepID=K8DXY3_9FIRM|nr:NADH-dependent [FeFe] hydrogenase, group A6 [Desulforamulus hydrothermalis]CCO07544.1 Iron hydrogenase 1 [Desulforamulus hydrothermalis Lam5 = DSM 18033]SHH31045.1 NAD(P)-dependent iron-only hydrogenase catalytic subunit [Desulforamulus hydrothermalis Lam5 = DSM 18033]
MPTGRETTGLPTLPHERPVGQPPIEKTGEKVTIYINDQPVQADKGTNVLEACRAGGYDIPSLCYLRDLNTAGSCRVCVVEIEGTRTLQAACVYPVAEGLRVHTHTARVRRARRRAVELLLSEHNRECPTCVRSASCELQALARKVGARYSRLASQPRCEPKIVKNPFIVRDYSKCIKCRRCEAVCKNMQGIGVYTPLYRGYETVIAPAFERNLAEVACIACGQCVLACPTGSLTERSYVEEVWQVIDDPAKHVVVQAAPAIQVSIGEEFGLPVGTAVTGQLAAALRRLGFDSVFSTDFAADLTIMEETHELLHRIDKGGPLPLISSCSPGWIKMCEHFYPEFIDNLSTCKSPMEMFGALAKTYYAQKLGLDPREMVVVGVMPCTAKKYEAARPEMKTYGLPDVDYVLTTRELAGMLRMAGIHLNKLPQEEFDQPLGLASGAANIFAATGGVMEAAVRTALALTEGKETGRLEFTEFRGSSGIKEATVRLKGRDIRLGVAHGTNNAKKLLNRLKAGEKFHFIEIMACAGGCVGGGGQPITGDPAKPELTLEHRRQRAAGLYAMDLGKELRRSHENPAVKQVYEEFLGAPMSKKAKEILHTSYTARGKLPGFDLTNLQAPAGNLPGMLH